MASTGAHGEEPASPGPVAPFDGSFYRELLEMAPDGVVVVDPSGIIRLVNRQIERMLGWRRSDLLGQPVELLVPKAARERHPGHRAAFAERPATRPMAAEMELAAQCADGGEVPVDISLSPFQVGDERWTASVVRDARARKQVEQALRETNSQLSNLVAELERRSFELSLINDMGDLLQSCLTAEEAHHIIAEFAGRAFPAGAGVLFVPDESGDGTFRQAAVWGDRRWRADAGLDAQDCWALRRGRTHRSADGIACMHASGPDAPRTVCFPLVAQGVLLGMMSVWDDRAGADPAGLASERVAFTVAEHISLALANLALRARLESQSRSDPLTGLFNRRQLESTLPRLLEESAATDAPLSVLAIDLDNFKVFNDTHGHAAGDDLLRSVSEVLRSSVRNGDSVFRIGGDEFLVVLPGSTEGIAARRASELLQSIDDAQVGVTASVGVATLTGVESAPELLGLADMRLYTAKRSGRHQIALVEAP